MTTNNTAAPRLQVQGIRKTFGQNAFPFICLVDMEHGAVRGKFSGVDTVRNLCFALCSLCSRCFCCSRYSFCAFCLRCGAFLCGNRAFCRCRIRCLTGTTAPKQQTGTQSAHDYDFIH